MEILEGNGSYGLKGIENKILLPPIYEEINILSSEWFSVRKNKKWGVFNFEGKKIINFIYDDIVLQDSCFIVLKDSNIGLLGFSGEVIIDAVYKSIENVIIENDFTKMETNKLILNSNFEYKGYCKDFFYDSDLHKNEHKCQKKIIKRICCTQHTRNQMKPIRIYSSHNLDLEKPLILTTDSYSELYIFSEGLLSNSRFEIIDPLTTTRFVVRQNGKYGIFAIEEGDYFLLLSCENDRLKFFGGDIVLVCQNNLWGATSLLLSDEDHLPSTVKIPTKFLNIKILNSVQTLFGVQTIDQDENIEYYTIWNMFNSEVSELFLTKKISDIIAMYDEFHILCRSNEKYGFISKKGFTTIPFIYDVIEKRKDNSFNVKIDNRWGVMALDGKVLFPIKYSAPVPFFIFEKGYEVETQGRVELLEEIIVEDALSKCKGIIDKYGIEKIPTIYEHILPLNNGLYFFGCGGYKDETYRNFFSEEEFSTWGCLDEHGKLIIEPKYNCFKIQNGFVLGGRDGHFIGSWDNCSDNIYYNKFDGVFDLFTIRGTLLIGGFREMLYDKSNNILALFYGGKWISKCICGDDSHNIYCYDYFLDRQQDLWLIIDTQLNTIIRNNNRPHTFNMGFMGKVEIKKEKEKEIHTYNMPISYMVKGFDSFAINSVIVKENNSANSRKAALDYRTGICTSFYDQIIQISSKHFYVSVNDKCGIITINDKILPIDYLLLTKPVNGYVFAIKEIDNKNSTVEFFNINNINQSRIVAIKTISTEKITQDVAYGRLKIYQSGFAKECDSNIQLPYLQIFDSQFLAKMSPIETKNHCSKWKDIYFFPSDIHNQTLGRDDEYSENEDPFRDSWYAMTDGMYGDMPEGFDGDFDFLGY